MCPNCKHTNKAQILNSRHMAHAMCQVSTCNFSLAIMVEQNIVLEKVFKCFSSFKCSAIFQNTIVMKLIFHIFYYIKRDRDAISAELPRTKSQVI